MTQIRLLPGLILAACLLPATLLLTWLLLARLDFVYPLWYQVLGIEQHIAFYAPQNRHGKGDFARTSPSEHRRLFGSLVLAIHGQEKLAAIGYKDSEGNTLGQFLDPDEIGHLEDVARLVKILIRTGWIFLFASSALILLMWWQRLPMPPPGRIAQAFAVLLGLGGLIVLSLGAREVFRLLHARIFPPGHPWFFFYQDSLMATSMKAPQIFAAIAGIWGLLSLAGYALIYVGLKSLLPGRPPKI